MISTRSLLAFGCILVCACGGDDDATDAGLDAPIDSATPDEGTADADSDAGMADAMADGDASEDASDPCVGVECGAGRCGVVDGVAACECDPGYYPEGLVCRADPCEGEDCPMTVSEWRALFDEEFENPRRDAEDCEALSTSTGSEQEHYFFAYCIDGLVSMWRATGDNSYLDTTLRLIENTVDDAEMDSDGYRYWPGPYEGHTYPLWDSYYWRQVTTLLRVMHHNPGLRAEADYQARFDALVEFSVRHIWEKWESGGLGNFYRSRTHMASHWARIGMDLFLITDEARFRVVFDNVSNGTLVGRPSNLREQFEDNPDAPGAYNWSSVWGETAAESVQDTSHAGAIVSFINEAADQDMYWDEADLVALTHTLLDVIWEPALEGAYHQNVDGTDPTSGGFTGPYGLPGRLGGRLHEWLHLGRHDAEIQERIETYYIDPERRNLRFYGYQALGIAALNARILADGAPVY